MCFRRFCPLKRACEQQRPLLRPATMVSLRADRLLAFEAKRLLMRLDGLLREARVDWNHGHIAQRSAQPSSIDAWSAPRLCTTLNSAHVPDAAR